MAFVVAIVDAVRSYCSSELVVGVRCADVAVDILSEDEMHIVWCSVEYGLCYSVKFLVFVGVDWMIDGAECYFHNSFDFLPMAVSLVEV